MKLRVILLHAGASHRLQVLFAPIEVEMPGNSVHQAFVALKDLLGASDTAHGEKCCMGSAKCRVGESQPFPVREATCARNPQGIVGCPAYSDSIGDTLLIQPERLRHASRYRIGSLYRMIEAFRSHWRDIRKATLHLVGKRQRGQKILAVPVGIFSGCKHRSQVVAWMAGLLFGEVAVVIVQVAYQRRVVKGRPVGSRFPAANQRYQWSTAKVFQLRPHHPNRWPLKRAESAAERI